MEKYIYLINNDLIIYLPGEEKHDLVKEEHEQTPTSFYYLPRDRLLCGFSNGMVAIWNLTENVREKIIQNPKIKNPIENLVQLNDNTFIYQGYKSSSFGLIDIGEGTISPVPYDVGIILRKSDKLAVSLDRKDQNLIEEWNFADKKASKIKYLGIGTVIVLDKNKFAKLNIVDTPKSYNYLAITITLTIYHVEDGSEEKIKFESSRMDVKSFLILPDKNLLLIGDSEFYLVDLSVDKPEAKLLGRFEINKGGLDIYYREDERAQKLSIKSVLLPDRIEKEIINKIIVLDDGMLIITLEGLNDLFVWN